MIWNTLVALLVVGSLPGQPGPSPIGVPAAKSSPRGRAILASIALPGTGEMILGHPHRGEGFLWADGALWALWAGFSWASSASEHDARLFAGLRAGADLTLKESRYYKAMEMYDNADQYNEQVRADARDAYPDDPERQHAYYQAQGYFGTQAWNWASDSARLRYYGKRRAGRNAALNAQFAVGGLLLNRLVSLVDCAFFSGGDGSESRVEFRSPDAAIGIKVCYKF